MHSLGTFCLFLAIIEYCLLNAVKGFRGKSSQVRLNAIRSYEWSKQQIQTHYSVTYFRLLLFLGNPVYSAQEVGRGKKESGSCHPLLPSLLGGQILIIFNTFFYRWMKGTKKKDDQAKNARIINMDILSVDFLWRRCFQNFFWNYDMSFSLYLMAYD